MGGETDEALYEEALTKLESALDIYEGLLRKQKYLAGDVRVDPIQHIFVSSNFHQEITLADLFHIPLGCTIESVAPDTLKKRPHVAKYVCISSWDGT